jgi:hypothetical protein
VYVILHSALGLVFGLRVSFARAHKITLLVPVDSQHCSVKHDVDGAVVSKMSIAFTTSFESLGTDRARVGMRHGVYWGNYWMALIYIL